MHPQTLKRIRPYNSSAELRKSAFRIGAESSSGWRVAHPDPENSEMLSSLSSECQFSPRKLRRWNIRNRYPILSPSPLPAGLIFFLSPFFPQCSRHTIPFGCCYYFAMERAVSLSLFLLSILVSSTADFPNLHSRERYPWIMYNRPVKVRLLLVVGVRRKNGAAGFQVAETPTG